MAKGGTEPPTRRGLLRALAAALAAAALPRAHVRAEEEKNPEPPIRILAGPAGSTEHALGTAMMKLLTSRVTGTRIALKPINSAFERLQLLNAGEAEIAFAAGHVLAAAHAGKKEFSFKAELKNLRAIAALHSDLIEIVAARGAGVAMLADLKGKRVSVGAPRSDVELAARAILAEAGVGPQDFRIAEYLAFADAAELLQKRELDAFFHMGLRPDDAMRALARGTEIAILEIQPEVVAKLGAPYRRAALPANSYRGQTAEVATALVPHYLATRAELSEETVHKLTKALFDHLNELAAAHVAGRAIRLDSAPRRPPVPLHPGAAKYFREKGVRF